MKKFTAIAVMLILVLVMMTACGGGESAAPEATYHISISPYDTFNYDEMVTLPDYSTFKVETAEVSISDSDVDTEIDERLAQAESDVQEVTEGTVDKGDEVTISFKGTLEDGSSPDAMNSDSYTLVLGEAQMIDGFQEGIYGATIGEPVTLDLQFPDPYEMDEELSGKNVTFEITVLSKNEYIEQELDDDFIKTDSEGAATTEEEYREFIKAYLQEQGEQEAIYNAETEIYQQILEGSEAKSYPEDEVESVKNELIEQYKSYAESQGQEYEEFIKTMFDSEETFNETLDEYVRDQIFTKMVVYALCEKEEITVTDEEYSERVSEYLTAFGVEDGEGFEAAYGMSVDDYMNMYEVPLNMYLDKVLEKLYNAQLEG